MLERYSSTLRRNAEFVQLVTAARNRLQSCYGETETPDSRIKPTKKRSDVSPDELRREKQCILDELRTAYEKLKVDWGGYAGYDEWFARGVNNAQLNSVATYYDLLPAFNRLLQANGGDLEKFYSAAKKLAKLPKAERQQRLEKKGKS
jgi:predicted aminopeptidase